MSEILENIDLLGGNLDISLGKSVRATNLTDEHINGQTIEFQLTNTTSRDLFVAFGGLIITEDDKDGNNVMSSSFYGNTDKLREVLKNDVFFYEGKVFAEMVPDPSDPGSTIEAGNLTVETLTPGRSVNQIVTSATKNPFRFTQFTMTSNRKDTAGNWVPDAGNYEGAMKAHWLSPFEDTVPEILPLRPLVVGGNNFNTNMLDVNFTNKGAFEFIMSFENFTVMQIKRNTQLIVTAKIGMQLSQAQKLYRIARKVDKALQPLK